MCGVMADGRSDCGGAGTGGAAQLEVAAARNRYRRRRPSDNSGGDRRRNLGENRTHFLFFFGKNKVKLKYLDILFLLNKMLRLCYYYFIFSNNII